VILTTIYNTRLPYSPLDYVAGCFFGALSSGFFSERFGRKPALLISVLIFFVGSLIQVCSGINSTSLTPLYVGRIIGGWGVGMNSAVCIVTHLL
jgi:MFS family permease